MLQITPNLGRRGQTGIAVTGINFTPSKSGIVLRCDGQVMASNLISDEAGRVSASFTIPTNARNGNRIVEMADGVYSARPACRSTIRWSSPASSASSRTASSACPWCRWSGAPRPSSCPAIPLAQTFSFTQNQVISSIGLQFTARDPSIPVTVQIRGVTTGLPNGVVFAEKVLAPNEISLSGETRIRFDDPFYAEANTSYSVVLLTNSTNYKVRTATLGKMGRWGIITRQTYMEGVLLESSNAETWTPLNGSDLAMKIYGYNFQSEGMIRFQPITGVQFSDINLDEYSAIPQGTGLDWEYSTDGGVTWDAMVPAEEERLPNLATRVQIRVRLSSSLSNDTPAINFRDVNLVGYLNKTTGAYLTRENELTQGVESTKAYVQMQIPSGTTLQWFASNDGGLTWEAMTIQETRPIDENWTEYTLVRTFTDNTGNKVRYKAEMTGTPLIYPRIHSLGATLS